jgi:hypothetical protein
MVTFVSVAVPVVAGNEELSIAPPPSEIVPDAELLKKVLAEMRAWPPSNTAPPPRAVLLLKMESTTANRLALGSSKIAPPPRAELPLKFEWITVSVPRDSSMAPPNFAWLPEKKTLVGLTVQSRCE